ncbi:MAG: GFA family protein [Pseudomonadota bacterium]
MAGSAAPEPVHRGRCYCGASRVEAFGAPQIVAYCHCHDCRRWTGGPVAVFAAFAVEDLRLLPWPEPRRWGGVTRWNCPECGSPLAAAFDYLPGQIYVPIGILEDAPSLAPSLHCHAENALPWLCLSDDLPRQEGSARAALGPRE